VECRRAQDNFWEYALRVYGRPGVEAACLDLQDRCNLVVNQLLFCCWVAGYGYGRLSAEEICSAAQIAEQWDVEVVAPLRAVRRQLKHRICGVDAQPCERLRQQVKRSELFSERLAQQLLVRTLNRTPGSHSCQDALLANLASYVEWCGVEPSPRDQRNLDLLAQAAVEEMAKKVT
jgi:uncharacterized protein (TIGR02444 family)